MGRPYRALAPDCLVRPRAGILAREIDGEMVLLDVEAGIYYGLNEVGARAFGLFAQGASLGAVGEQLSAEYDAPSEALISDLEQLVRDLAEHGLVDVADA